MVSSNAKTVAEYVAGVPEDRRAELKRVRALVRKHLPKGFREAMNWGMICYEVPLSRKPDTYNGQPLMFAALAAQKHKISLYLTHVYMDPKLRGRLLAGFERIGKKPDMGKSCIRFKSADDLPLDVIGELIADASVDEFVAGCERLHGGR